MELELGAAKEMPTFDYLLELVHQVHAVGHAFFAFILQTLREYLLEDPVIASSFLSSKCDRLRISLFLHQYVTTGFALSS